MKRSYGSDTYWITRYERETGEDETDEWLFSWSNLKPLLRLPKSAALVDLGCGTSALCLDAVGDACDIRAVGVDIAPAAIGFQRAEQKIRAKERGSRYSHAEFICKDLCQQRAWEAADHASFDACIDKATTDGLLCDTKRGAARVRAMYRAIAPALRPEALVVVLSWRSPQIDGVEWCIDCVLGGLREGSASRDNGASGEADDGDALTNSAWTLDVHSVVREEEEEGEAADGDAQGPHVYLLRRRSRRRSRRKHAAAQRAGGDDSLEEELEMRHHLHVMSS